MQQPDWAAALTAARDAALSYGIEISGSCTLKAVPRPSPSLATLMFPP